MNTEQEALEVRYLFPLEDGCTVCKFEAVLDSGIIRYIDTLLISLSILLLQPYPLYAY
jgi:hypothetical protein